MVARILKWLLKNQFSRGGFSEIRDGYQKFVRLDRLRDELLPLRRPSAFAPFVDLRSKKRDASASRKAERAKQ